MSLRLVRGEGKYWNCSQSNNACSFPNLAGIRNSQSLIIAPKQPKKHHVQLSNTHWFSLVVQANRILKLWPLRNACRSWMMFWRRFRWSETSVSRTKSGEAIGNTWVWVNLGYDVHVHVGKSIYDISLVQDYWNIFAKMASKFSINQYIILSYTTRILKWNYLIICLVCSQNVDGNGLYRLVFHRSHGCPSAVHESSFWQGFYEDNTYRDSIKKNNLPGSMISWCHKGPPQRVVEDRFSTDP